MPIPFQDLSENDHADAVAWLRLIREEGGGGVRAALFHTSIQGQPLAFSFTRAETPRPYSTQPDNADAFRTTLAKSLFQAAALSPALILSLAEEMPHPAFAGHLRLGIPLCRVKGASPPFGNGNPPRLLWATNEPGYGSSARRALDRIMEGVSPFEPFERVAKALSEAFADQRALALTSVPGMTTVVSLDSPGERAEHPADSTMEAGGGPGASTREERLPPGLANRLWAALSAPGHAGARRRDFQLEWPGTLMPFQLDGVQALLERDRLLLADDMGLGKTLQAIAALRILRKRRAIRSCLVVAPASLLDQWRREIAKWGPELSAIIIRGSSSDRAWQWAAAVDITLVSYDTLRSDFGANAQSPVRRKIWDVVVADEAQRVKNRNDTSQSLKGLQRLRSWALTGTPIENREEELASILEFVDHNGQGPRKGFSSIPALLERHRELQLRRKKGDVLADLPPKQTTKLTLELHANQRSSYDKAENDGVVYLKSLGAEVKVRHILELISRLKQICNADPKTGESSKLADIRERLERLIAQGHRALVFSQYVRDTSGVAAAANYLREFNPLTITGETPLEERAAVIDRFKTRKEHGALVLSLRAGGLGLNLQEASYVFHLDRWWNPAVERQAEDRTHRIGQTVKVNVIKYACADTIEERIDRALERKQGIFDRLIDDVSLDLSTQLDRQELLSLFGLGDDGVA